VGSIGGGGDLFKPQRPKKVTAFRAALGHAACGPGQGCIPIQPEY
jgi:hypothetical protein